MNVRLQRVTTDFKDNLKAQWLLTMFYGIHLVDKWELEQRFYQLKQWELMLAADKSFVIVAHPTTKRHKREPAGFALCTYPTSDHDIIILDGLYVLPKHRRKGVGSRLIKEVRKEGEIHTQSFAEAVDFYKTQGFRELLHRESDNTTEMTTASYEFVYEHEYLVPTPRKEDAAHMVYLRNLTEEHTP